MDALQQYLESIATQIQAEDQGVNPDLQAHASTIADSVESFLVDGNMATSRTNGAFVSNESFDMDACQTIGAETISSLVADAGVPSRFAKQAAEQVAIIIARAANGGSTSGAWSGQFIKSDAFSSGNATEHVSMEQLYSPEIAAGFAGDAAPSNESFGVSMDNALTDMKSAIAVSLLKWHTTITPRVLSVIGTAQAQVTYTKETIEIYNLNDTDTVSTSSLVDIFADPDLVTNELKKIDVLTARDTDNQLVADGVIKFNESVNILKLAIDPTKFGYAKMNRTDIVADNVLLEAVHLSLDNGTVVESFRLQIPKSHGRLTRINNGQSVDRSADVEHKVVLQNGVALTASGAASAILAGLSDANDALIVTLTVRPSVNLRTGVTQALASWVVGVGNVAGTTPDAGSVAVKDSIVTGSDKLVGYELDARHSEENIRKTNIAAHVYKSQLAYDIPTGRNYVMDHAINDPRSGAGSNVANLNSIIRVGQDNRVLRVVEGTLKDTARAIEAYEADPTGNQTDPGRYFAAGGQVRPTVIEATLDFTNITSIRDADRFGDVKQRVLSFFTSITAQIHANSFYVQQLVKGTKPTYRLITNNRIMSNVLGVPHFHDLLTRTDPGHAEEKLNSDGVELRIVLPNGVILECITTTFLYWENKIVIVPCLPSAPKSVLNFGHNLDYGTMVGNYNHSNGDGAANNRLFANARELPLVTSPIGAIIDVVGVEVASFRP